MRFYINIIFNQKIFALLFCYNETNKIEIKYKKGG